MKDQMETKIPLEEAYFAKPTWLKTWSGIPLKEVYTPEDVKDLDYSRDLANPGQFPYTRGPYTDMYRGRLWSVREVSGHSSPRITNEWLKYLVAQGSNAINVICDVASIYAGVDSDHPVAEGTVGLMGTPICSLRDMETMVDGLPLDELSCTLTMGFAQHLMYLAVCEKRGVPWSKVRGTFFTDYLTVYLVRAAGDNEAKGTGSGMRLSRDGMLWYSKNVPMAVPICIGAEGIRESGATAAQEIAFAFCSARAYLKEVLNKGADIEEMAPRIAFTFRCGIDIFEEAAKFRAARRVWAKMLSEDYGAKSKYALRLRVHVVTKGSDLTEQQAELNIIRIAYQALAAILGGVQSMHTCSFDEPICLPTEESVRIALRTQQILAYETGAITVADPLGGSYYVESLTNTLEEEIWKIIREWDKKDFVAAVEHDTLMDSLLGQAYKFQRQIENGERIMVGVNKFTIPEESEQKRVIFEVDEKAVAEHIASVKELRKTRDNKKVKQALDNLRRAFDNREENFFPAAYEAVKANCTNMELMGVLRMSYGLPYDRWGLWEYPFKD